MIASSTFRRVGILIGVPTCITVALIWVVPLALPILALSASSVPAQPTAQAASKSLGAAAPMPTPPPKDYCGEDMQRFYALFLADQSMVPFMNSANLNDGTFDATAMGRTGQSIVDEQHAIDQRLRDKGCYFYPGGGSVFMDYKIVRDAHWAIGEHSAWVAANLNTSMNADQIVAICLAQVKTWWP